MRTLGWKGAQVACVLDAMHLASPRIRVALFIPNFRIGGAERQVFELASRLSSDKYGVTVIALRGDGTLRRCFQSLPDSRIVIVDRRTPVAALRRLIRELRTSKIQVLHSFLTSANVYSLLGSLFLPQLKVVIGLRDSIPDSHYGSPIRRIQTRLLSFVLRRLRFFSDVFVTNSEAGRLAYEERFRIRSVVIPNGVDTQKFKPDSVARDLLRQVVGEAAEVKFVGIVANCTGYKDYPTFILAAKVIVEKLGDVHFICIGEDRTDTGARVKDLVRESGLEPVFHFLGTRQDVHQLVPGLDVLCSSSVTEGFSNAVAEAMACGVPCVVTDVGDSRRIVGDTGIVVPPRSPEALAVGVIALLNKSAAERKSLSFAARRRIVQTFEVAEMTRQHESLYRSLLFKTASEAKTMAPSSTGP
jgi:glycosyltransferase involved in cell wall biosynthesis